MHSREEEAFYIVRGELIFRAGDREVTASAGTLINVPRGTKHRFRNETADDAEMTFWFAPAGIEGLFREFGERPQAIVEIGKRYGTEYFFGE